VFPALSVFDEGLRAPVWGKPVTAHFAPIVTLAWSDSRYPAWLRVLPDPPPVLWARGDLSVLEQPSVAIVGSRAASQYAKTVARSLAAGLARAGLAVTSGLARGVDGAAHLGCLDAGGRTIAVVGTGVDVVYPAEHAELAERIANAGLLVSELEPGAPPNAWHFPRRNRIISGLSRARCRRRSVREERLADNGPAGARAGTRGHGRAGKRVVRPESRRTRAY